MENHNHQEELKDENKKIHAEDSLAGLGEQEIEDRADSDLTSAFVEVEKEERYDLTEDGRDRLQKADLMLNFITNSGIDIPEQLLRTVVKCKYIAKRGEWTPSTEAVFLMSYNELVKLIKPLSVDSIISSRPTLVEEDESQSPIAKFFKKIFHKKFRVASSLRSVRIYSFLTAIMMILLLVTQIFFYLGSTRLASITECETQLEEKQKRLNELMLFSGKVEDAAIQSECDKVYNDCIEIDNKRKSNIDLLGPWVKHARKISLNSTIYTDTIGINSRNGDKANTAIIQEAKSFAIIIGIYILPLLYGIIGGFTFVLRDLTEDIRKLTFTKGSNTKYILRILLGAIAGLSVGLFWGDIESVQQFGLASLSPMLLAFLGGYCVEYLLQFLEKTAKSFFKKYDPENEPLRRDRKEVVVKEVIKEGKETKEPKETKAEEVVEKPKTEPVTA